jgi:hypothetical protein
VTIVSEMGVVAIVMVEVSVEVAMAAVVKVEVVVVVVVVTSLVVDADGDADDGGELVAASISVLVGTAVEAVVVGGQPVPESNSSEVVSIPGRHLLLMLLQPHSSIQSWAHVTASQ